MITTKARAALKGVLMKPVGEYTGDEDRLVRDMMAREPVAFADLLVECAADLRRQLEDLKAKQLK